MTEALLEAGGLVLGYRRGRRGVLRVSSELDLTVRAGQLVCLLGPNGAGKSTLLRTLAGMQPALSGWIRLLGRDLEKLSPSELARRVSVVLTEPMTTGNLTSRVLVSLGRYPYTDWTGRLSTEDWAKVDRALEVLGAEALAERPVAELSDGERQKILIARALAQEPRIMILDEPTSFLDLPRRIEMLALLRELVRSQGCSVILATHHLDLALHYADRLWLQQIDGPFESGAPEDLALSGALERTFSSRDLRFDSERGEFRFARRQGGQRIGLQGEGLPVVWTRHALERLGFEVTADLEGDRVRVVEAEGSNRWQWFFGEREGCEGSIESLTARLSERPATPRAAVSTSSRQ